MMLCIGDDKKKTKIKITNDHSLNKIHVQCTLADASR